MIDILLTKCIIHSILVVATAKINKTNTSL